MSDEFRVGNVLGRAIGVYLRNFVPFTFLVTLVYSPLIVLVVTTLYGDLGNDDLAFIAVALGFGTILLGIVTGAAVAYGTFEQLRGRRISMLASVSVGLRRLVPVLLMTIVMTFFVALGWIALVVPGVMLICRWWVAVPVAVVERPGILASLGRSSELTRGYRWKVFGIVFVLGLVGVGARKLFEATILSKPYATLPEIKVYLAATLATNVLIGGLTAVVTCVAYHDLRTIKEGLDSDELAAVFE